jgi:hypothetical protein
MHPLNKLKQDGAELVTRQELEEALAPIRAALEIDELDQEIVLDENGELVEGEDEIPAELDEHEEEPTPRRSRKRKPENVDPLDLVPEPEEEG